MCMYTKFVMSMPYIWRFCLADISCSSQQIESHFQNSLLYCDVCEGKWYSSQLFQSFFLCFPCFSFLECLFQCICVHFSLSMCWFICVEKFDPQKQAQKCLEKLSAPSVFCRKMSMVSCWSFSARYGLHWVYCFIRILMECPVFHRYYI